MPDRRHLLGAAAVAGASIAALRGAAAQTAAQPAAPAGMSAGDRLNQPGPEERLLAGRVGIWEVTETNWASPGAPPETTTGLVAERVMMGSLLQEFLRAPSDTARRNVKRTDLLSYNRLEGRWLYVSFDMRVPIGLMPAGSADRGDGTSISMSFAPFAVTGPGTEATGQLLRMEQTITFQAPDRDVKDQYFTVADGNGTRWLGHRYAYVRRS